MASTLERGPATSAQHHTKKRRNTSIGVNGTFEFLAQKILNVTILAYVRTSGQCDVMHSEISLNVTVSAREKDKPILGNI
jgi:hypothetical protein